MVDHGKFESMVPYITVKPQKCARRQGRSAATKYAEKFGTKEIQIPIDQTDLMAGPHRQLPGLHAHAARSRTWMSRPAPARWS